MSFKVIQWATGDLASKAIPGIVGHPDLELVGTWVHSEEKEGRDVGELCGIAAQGVTATRDKQALLDMEADCVCYMAGRTWTQDPMTTVDELASILRSGKNVVNATWPSLVYPQALGNGIYEKLEEACLEGGTTLYTGGIDPGYGSAGLALTALNVMSEVRSVRTFEIMNYAPWDHPEMITMLGFGQPDVGKCPLLMPGVTAGIFNSSLELMANAMGITIDEVVEDHSVLYADEPFDVSTLRIEPGTISGIRFEVKGLSDGVERVIVEHVTKLRDEDYAEVDFPGDGYRAEVDGEPCIRLDMSFTSHIGDGAHAAYVACAMAVVNAIPQVCEAEPGILTILDLLPYPSRNLRRERP